MTIIRSDNDGNTSNVTVAAMRAELNAHPDVKIYDPEVSAIENATILLFAFDGDPDPSDVTIVAGTDGEPGSVSFTIRD